MDYNSILLIAGLIMLVFGLLGVVLNKEGKTTLFISSFGLRITLVAIGLTLCLVSAWLQTLADRVAEKDLEARIQQRASPALASYVAGCSLDVQSFEADFPAIPFQGSTFRTVFLSEEGAHRRSLDELLLERLESDPARRAGASIASTGLPVIVSGPGTGKSVVMRAVRARFCRDSLAGDLDTLVITKDIRKDLASPADRAALDRFLLDLPKQLGGSPVKRILLLDSLDEQYTASPAAAQTTVQWARDRAQSEEFAVNVYLFSRPYAVENLNKDQQGLLTPILGNFGPTSEYYEKSVYAIVHRRAGLPSASGRERELRQRLAEPVQIATSRLKSFLGDDWVARAVSRKLTFRDIDAIIEATDGDETGGRLGDAYYFYATQRLVRDLAVDVPEPADTDLLLRCLGWEFVQAKLGANVASKTEGGGRLCERQVNYLDAGVSRNESARRLLALRSMNIASIEGYIQDVAAGIGLCLLASDVADAEGVSLAGANDQGAAIALTAKHSINSCPMRSREAQFIGFVAPDVRTRFKL
jgi:hypothetical protein